jgi:hypothetical protein
MKIFTKFRLKLGDCKLKFTLSLHEYELVITLPSTTNCEVIYKLTFIEPWHKHELCKRQSKSVFKVQILQVKSSWWGHFHDFVFCCSCCMWYTHGIQISNFPISSFMHESYTVRRHFEKYCQCLWLLHLKDDFYSYYYY